MENKIRAVIAEDVEAYLDTIAQLIREVAPEVQIVGKASTLRLAGELIESLSPDLVFLDIQFEEEGTTAFDLLRQIQKPDGFPFRIIFITAHLEASYYAEAFHFGALHFLEKPIDKEKLKDAIARAMQKNHPSSEGIWMEQLKQLEKQIRSFHFPGKMVVEGNKYTEVISLTDVILLEASGRYTRFTLSDGRQILACQNLGEYDKVFRNYLNFCRIHHNKIINLNFVKRYSKRDRIIELIPPYGNHIASKERMKEFLNMFETEGK